MGLALASYGIAAGLSFIDCKMQKEKQMKYPFYGFQTGYYLNFIL